MRPAHIAMTACILLAVLAAPATAAPGGQGNGNGNSFGYGYGNGNGRSGAGGGAAGGPAPLIGATLLGQLGVGAGAYLVWRRRRKAADLASADRSQPVDRIA